MTTTILNYQIVGAFYRPPAQLIINALSPDTKLFLRAEPTNQYDPNAIQVLVKTENLSNCHDALIEELAKKGLELNQILEQPEWHLGYVYKEIASELKLHHIITDDEELEGKFHIDYAGKFNISVEI